MPPSLTALEGVYSTFIKSALSLVGIASIVMIVVSGFNYLASGGDKEGLARAKNTLTYSIVGLVLAISAWLILFMFGKFLGIEFGTFSLQFGNP